MSRGLGDVYKRQVMDGGIDLFINAYLKWIALGTGAKEEEA